MYIYRPPYPNELLHYGIPGQKWGVRRFQNEDGTLTSAGKDRYAETVSSRKKDGVYANLEYSYGGNYRTPRFVTNKKDYDPIDRAKEWLTGNKHEYAVNQILTSGYGNQRITSTILNGMYGYTLDDIERITNGELPVNVELDSLQTWSMYENPEEKAQQVAREHWLETEYNDKGGDLLADFYHNKVVIDQIVEDYQKHTLPGIIDSIVAKGKSLIKKLFG